MRYGMIASIIGIMWISALIISGSYPDDALQVFILTLISSVVVFHIGFK